MATMTTSNQPEQLTATTIRLPIALHRAAKVYAVQSGLSLQALIATALAERIGKDMRRA